MARQKTKSLIDASPLSLPLWIPFAMVASTFFLQHYTFDLFSRELLSFEDHASVTPLFNLSLTEYFQRGADGLHFCYPLVDLTFVLDHWFSSILGFQTFWVTQWLLFAAYLSVCFHLLRQLVHSKPWFLSLFAVLCFHPMNVQLIQWISFRRSLVTALLCLWATDRTIALLKKKKLSFRDIGIPFTLWAVSPLSYLDGVLWFLGMLYLLSPNLGKRRTRLGLVVGALVAFLYIRWVSSHNEYQSDYGVVFSWDFVRHLVYFFPRVMGRGTWNLTFPLNTSIYYSEVNRLFIVGFIIFLFSLVLVAWKVKSLKASRLEKVFWFWAVLIFAPHCLALFAREDFVLADRYLFLILPYILVGLWFTFFQRLSTKVAYATLGTLIPLYISVNVLSAPKWRDSTALAIDCASKEKAPKCFAYALQKFIAKVDCSGAKGIIADGRQILDRETLPFSHSFMHNFPFFDGICTLYDRSMPAEVKRQQIESLIEKRGRRAETLVPLVLLEISQSRIDSAFETAAEYLPREGQRLHRYSIEFMPILIGHVEALCEIRSSEECLESAAVLSDTFWNLSRDPARRKWGWTITKYVALKGLPR